MRKRILLAAVSLLFWVTYSHAAWDASKPADNGIISQAPAQIRSNWTAIATGTDANLCVTNAKVCAGASIADSKLAQITAAGKISGASFTGLSSIPSSAAGQVPIANGGTGASTAQAALDAILPTQSGNSGKALITNASNGSWGYPGGLNITSQAQGDILYYNGSAWVRLGAGTSGQVLKTNGAGANPSWGGGSFGSWLLRDGDTVYQATTDGFVVAYLSADPNGYGLAVGYTDSSNPPTSGRITCSVDRRTGNNETNGFTMPVKTGDYWKVEKTTTSGTIAAQVYWIPLG